MVGPVPELSTLAAFAAAALALLVVPGPSVLYIVTCTAEHGRRAGLASVAGVHAGSMVHVVAAAAGLSAILVRSAVAFQVVKYAGAAYLVVLGVRRLAGRNAAGDADHADGAGGPVEAAAGDAPVRRLFWRGALVNVLNPKTALFFLAFLPQFVDPGRGSVAGQALALGAAFIALGVSTDGAYALVAASVATRLRPALRRRLRWTGAVYLALGASAARATR